jgi:hypothetical protein
MASERRRRRLRWQIDVYAVRSIKPWRTHMWITPKKLRDAAFYTCIAALIALYMRPLAWHASVISMDEKTSLQPRPRLHPIKPPWPDHVPNRTEHAYKRGGALPLFAAFDTCTGQVSGAMARGEPWPRSSHLTPCWADSARSLRSRVTVQHRGRLQVAPHWTRGDDVGHALGHPGRASRHHAA